MAISRRECRSTEGGSLAFSPRTNKTVTRLAPSLFGGDGLKEHHRPRKHDSRKVKL